MFKMIQSRKKKDIQKARHAFEQEFQQEQEISERQPQEHQPFGNLKKKKSTTPDF